jgi:hypothetical protein
MTETTTRLPDDHPHQVFGTMGNLRAYREFNRRRQLTDRGVVVEGERDYLPPDISPSEFIEHYYHQRTSHPVPAQPAASPPLDGETVASVLHNWRKLYAGQGSIAYAASTQQLWIDNLPGWTARQFLDAVRYYPASQQGPWPPNPGRLRAAWDEHEAHQQEQREDAYIVRHRKLQAPLTRLPAKQVHFLVEDMIDQFKGYDRRRSAIVTALRAAGYRFDHPDGEVRILEALRWWQVDQRCGPKPAEVVAYAKGLA